MAKLFRLFAASFGGGVLLGAGIRLGGSLVAEKAAPSGQEADHARLSAIEKRLDHTEQRVEGHGAELSELRQCSLRTERSLQTLLSNLERIVSPRASEDKDSGHRDEVTLNR